MCYRLLLIKDWNISGRILSFLKSVERMNNLQINFVLARNCSGLANLEQGASQLSSVWIKPEVLWQKIFTQKIHICKCQVGAPFIAKIPVLLSGDSGDLDSAAVAAFYSKSAANRALPLQSEIGSLSGDLGQCIDYLVV